MTISPKGWPVAPLPTRFFIAIDEHGRVCYQPNGESAFWIISHESIVDAVAIIPISYLHVTGLALTFLHAKNVKVVTPDKIKRRRVPRERKYENRFHRLKVSAIGQRRQSVSSGTGITQSLHIVRGHFREYGPEHGKGLLFGRYSGRFWIAAHFSGSDEIGTVDKDYEIDAPQEGGD